MRPRVVQILYSGLGGHGSVAFSLLDAAENAGDWDSRLVFIGIEPLLPEYERKCVKHDIPYEYIPTVQGQPWRSWKQLYNTLRQLQPNAILLHSVKTILPCKLYSTRHKIPLVAVEHQQNMLKKRSEWLVSKLLMKLADAIIFLTPQYHADIQQELGPTLRPEKIHVIPSGINTDLYAPLLKKKNKSIPSVTIGMAARFSSTKQQGKLVHAVKQLRRFAPQVDWHLTLAGEGEMLSGIKDLIRQEKLEKHVDLPGYLGQEELIDWFNGVDIYAHASDGETLSTSLLQAMAMQLPIVASDVPGINNLLSQGEGCGLLVAEQTAAGFMNAIHRLTENQKQADELAKRARETAIRHYSQEAMFAEYKRILLECTKSFT